MMQIYSESYRLIGSEIQMQNILTYRSYLFFIIFHLFFVRLSLFLSIVMTSRQNIRKIFARLTCNLKFKVEIYATLTNGKIQSEHNEFCREYKQNILIGCMQKKHSIDECM